MKTETKRPERIEALFSGMAEDLPARLPEEIGDDTILWVGRPRIHMYEVLWKPFLEVMVISLGMFVLLGIFLLMESLKELRDASWLLYLLFGLLLAIRITNQGLILRRCKNTRYIVTDRQAIIMEDKKDRLRVVSFEAQHFQRLVRRERKDGTGDLLFEGVWPTEFSESREFENGFYGIENVAEVERLIRKRLLSGK